MTEDRDLLPWILGGLSMAAVAMAIAVGLTGRTTPAHAASHAMTTLATADLNPKIPTGGVPVTAAPTSATPTSAAPTSAAPSAATAPDMAAGIVPAAGTLSNPAASSSMLTPSQSPAAAISQAAAPNSSGTRIWECTTNGAKTFSTDRCGSTAIVRDVGPINVMDASPVASNVHWYGPDSNDAPDYYDPTPPGGADNFYPAVVGIPYLERRRPQHSHQPNNHHGHPRHN